jgi:hypothetical protein
MRGAREILFAKDSEFVESVKWGKWLYVNDRFDFLFGNLESYFPFQIVFSSINRMMEEFHITREKGTPP